MQIKYLNFGRLRIGNELQINLIDWMKNGNQYRVHENKSDRFYPFFLINVSNNSKIKSKHKYRSIF